MDIKPTQPFLNKGISLGRGVLGAWMLSEGGGLELFDSSGLKKHTTYTNGHPLYDWVPSKYGLLLNFDDSASQHIHADVAVSYPFSLVCLLDNTHESSVAIQFSAGDSGGTFYSGIYSDGATEIGILRNQGTVRINTKTVSAGVHQVVGVFRSRTSAEVYVDGALYAAETDDTGAGETWDRVSLGVAADGTPYGYSDSAYSYGIVYDRAVSEQEVRTLWERKFSMLK